MFQAEPLSFLRFHFGPVSIQDYLKSARSSKLLHFHDTPQTLDIDRNPYDPCNLCNRLRRSVRRRNSSTATRSDFDELCSNRERRHCYASRCKATNYV